jgi:hypothetical protein
LWEVEPEDWWESVPGLMALYPLCRHHQSPGEAIRYSARVIERLPMPAGQQSGWLDLLGIFSGLLLPGPEVLQIIGREKMQESSVYRVFLGDGERRAILRILRARFGPELPQDLIERLDRLVEPAQLEPLIDRAATCSDLDEFMAALSPRKRRR